MNLIKPKFEILEQPSGLNGMYKQIELAGRTCYRSEDKITEDSARDFVDRMINSGHGAMLEHGTVYLRCDFKVGTPSNAEAYSLWSRYINNKYSVALQIQPNSPIPDGYTAITTNLRVLVENNWMDDLKYICEPTEYHEKRVTVRFTSDIHFYKDTTRHRVFSWAIESTRQRRLK